MILSHNKICTGASRNLLISTSAHVRECILKMMGMFIPWLGLGKQKQLQISILQMNSKEHSEQRRVYTWGTPLLLNNSILLSKSFRAYAFDNQALLLARFHVPFFGLLFSSWLLGVCKKVRQMIRPAKLTDLYSERPYNLVQPNLQAKRGIWALVSSWNS